MLKGKLGISDVRPDFIVTQRILDVWRHLLTKIFQSLYFYTDAKLTSVGSHC